MRGNRMSRINGVNPALDLPLTETPFTVSAFAGAHVYFFEFPSEPSADEYVAAVNAIKSRAAKGGLVLEADRTVYRPTAEIRWPEIEATLPLRPIHVR